MRDTTTINVRALTLVTTLVLAISVAMMGCVSNGAANVPPADLNFVIPLGTAASQTSGASVSPIPTKIQLVAGQSVTVKNDDVAMHYFFSAPIAPGQTLRKTFDQPGTFSYSGTLSCSIAGGESLTVEVAER